MPWAMPITWREPTAASSEAARRTDDSATDAWEAYARARSTTSRSAKQPGTVL